MKESETKKQLECWNGKKNVLFAKREKWRRRKTEPRIRNQRRSVELGWRRWINLARFTQTEKRNKDHSIKQKCSPAAVGQAMLVPRRTRTSQKSLEELKSPLALVVQNPGARMVGFMRLSCFYQKKWWKDEGKDVDCESQHNKWWERVRNKKMCVPRQIHSTRMGVQNRTKNLTVVGPWLLNPATASMP